jgi:hypothetical protein
MTALLFLPGQDKLRGRSACKIQSILQALPKKLNLYNGDLPDVGRDRISILQGALKNSSFAR